MSLKLSAIDWWTPEFDVHLEPIGPEYALDHFSLNESKVSAKTLDWLFGQTSALRSLTYTGDLLQIKDSLEAQEVLCRKIDQNRRSLMRLEVLAERRSLFQRLSLLDMHLTATIALGTRYNLLDDESQLIAPAAEDSSPSQMAALWTRINPQHLTLKSVNRGNFLALCALLQALEDGHMPALGQVVIDGPYLGDRSSLKIKEACENRGIGFEAHRIIFNA